MAGRSLKGRKQAEVQARIVRREGRGGGRGAVEAKGEGREE